MSAYPSDEQVEARLSKIRQEAESGGYQLNPDLEFVKMLVEGLLVNEQRYGYPSCPCRIASGVASEDLDIVCPCDYRDPDLAEYEACYCALYVSQAIAKGIKKPKSIPERRPPPEQRTQPTAEPANAPPAKLTYPVWRCRVCGYLCARDEPPETCPICKAKKERFERFM
ncbi:MAG: Ferredoxin thioredoxin reductase catalytic beta chain [Chloroflexi bacterium ADurb.Bin180]|nr:MAG: Ferredoxin thioredoxin reductase catalytic beta chain [Chloroflexi bacterium ADurb.Bin180]HNR95793.1 ferredoxin-thioredoxin reductase catalytic domain-containing protein [Anaerolineae bacterium]HNT06431.1 ferredoxin-thioredoxin reductase catalytic domain-containing protein [Anaerolineae bacterium]HOU23324.1 ferredoxin-thioredoxin reductase catalytic domain-containing protein [Anaerolineae bacterium]HQJ51285.1 ferredoxin-thioredoxin reductase catalytic domain-containing protein [Anaeroli